MKDALFFDIFSLFLFKLIFLYDGFLFITAEQEFMLLPFFPKRFSAQGRKVLSHRQLSSLYRV